MFRLGDALFGAATFAEPSGRHWWARYLALAAALAGIICIRRPDAILRPQFWAEDGNVFFYQEVTLGLWSAVRTWYGNFPFLVQRLVASIATVAPIVRAPLIYNAGAIAITALTMATFSLPAFRHLVRNDGVRAAVCAATVCMPADQELLGTPTTLGYFLAIWITLLSVMRTPRSRVGVAGWTAGGALAVWSTQLATVAVPLLVLRAVHGARRRRAPDVGFAVTQLAALLAVILAVGGMTRVAGMGGTVAPAGASRVLEWQPVHLWWALRGLGWAMACCTDAALMPLSILAARGTWLVVAPPALVALCVALAFRDLAIRGRVVVCLAIYLMAASLYLVMAGRPIILLALQTPGPDRPLCPPLGARHRALPNFAFLLGAAGIIDAAHRLRIRLGAAAVTCIGLLLAWTPAFHIPPLPDLRWPLWAARLEAKLASGSREPLVIPSYPPSFEIVFDAPSSPASHAQPAHDERGDQR